LPVGVFPSAGGAAVKPMTKIFFAVDFEDAIRVDGGFGGKSNGGRDQCQRENQNRSH